MSVVRNVCAPTTRIGHLRQQTLCAPHAVGAFRAKHGLLCTHTSTAYRRVACNVYSEEAEKEQNARIEKLIKQYDKEVWVETRPYYLFGLGVILILAILSFVDRA